MHAQVARIDAGPDRTVVRTRACCLMPVKIDSECAAYHRPNGIRTRLSWGRRMKLSEYQLTDLRARMIARSRLLEGEIAAKLCESTNDAEMLGRVGDSAELAWVATESGLGLTEAQRDIEEWCGLCDSLRRMELGSYGA